MSTQEYIRSVTEILPDEFPTLTPLPEGSGSGSQTSSGSFLSNISWQTWIIIILILALLGINILAYLAKGVQETSSIFEQVFMPILRLFGYTTLETTKQVVETTATGTKAGVDIAANTTTGAINTVQQAGNMPMSTSGTSVGVSTANANIPQGQMSNTSLPVQEKIQQAGASVDQWQEDSLEKALSNASQSYNASANANGPEPDSSRSSIQTTGKSGWCYIGEDHGIRTCAEIGVNDVCMSGDVFPNQAICMNPNLRA
jgi:hypothetical protein